MDFNVPFIFRNKERQASVVIDYLEEPCFIFVMLKDEELIKEFGEDLSIKTDLQNILASDFAYPELDNLREAIFSAIRLTMEFATIRVNYPTGKKWPSEKELQ